MPHLLTSRALLGRIGGENARRPAWSNKQPPRFGDLYQGLRDYLTVAAPASRVLLVAALEEVVPPVCSVTCFCDWLAFPSCLGGAKANAEPASINAVVRTANSRFTISVSLLCGFALIFCTPAPSPIAMDSQLIRRMYSAKSALGRASECK